MHISIITGHSSIPATAMKAIVLNSCAIADYVAMGAKAFPPAECPFDSRPTQRRQDT
jgi:carbonic anhydrase/acetyltransferase-like protein (isoleucine patch superfamily)